MIGYYIHHQGLGHLTRAQSIATASNRAFVALSSVEPPQLGPFTEWVALARDDEAADPPDVTAGGALHWAPLADPGYSHRMRQIVDWVMTARPEAVVVDVSVEVAALVRLLGTKVIVMAGPGQRTDPPHQLAYTLASRIIAPWPESVYRPAYLEPFHGKTTYVGSISRFDGADSRPPTGNRTVLSLFGKGGSDVRPRDLADAAAADPRWTWRHLGGEGAWSGDVWSALQDADVVVAHAGQNAVAEIAAARRPAVLIPQDRPFDEQHGTAAALGQAGIAVTSPTWPDAAQWTALLAQAAALDGGQWSRWSPGDGAARAGAVIDDVVGTGAGV